MTLRHAVPALLLASALAAAPSSRAADAGGRLPVAPSAPVEVKVRPSGDVLVVTHEGTDEGRRLELSVDGDRVVMSGDADPDVAWLGVIFAPDGEALRIQGVAKDSPAAAADIRPGDVLRRVGGEPVSGSKGLLEGHRPGDKVEMTLVRDEREVVVKPRLAGRPARVEFDVEDGLGAFAVAGEMEGAMAGLERLRSLSGLPKVLCLGESSGQGGEDCLRLGLERVAAGPRLGITVEPLTEQLASFFSVENGKGLLVTEVVDDSPAERAGLVAGDVLVGVLGRPVAHRGDVAAALAGSKAGDEVALDVVRRGRAETLTAELDERSFTGLGGHALEALGALAWKEGQLARATDADRALANEELAQAARARSEALAADGEARRAIEEALRASRGDANLRLQLEELRKELESLRLQLHDEKGRKAQRER